MEIIVEYFENIPALHRSIILVVGISFFWLLEGALPLFIYNYKKWRHALPNFFFHTNNNPYKFFIGIFTFSYF